MTYYFWKGVDRNGRVLQGYFLAIHADETYAYLYEQAITPLRVVRYFFWMRRLTKKNILYFTQQLAVLLNANMTLGQALTLLASSMQQAALQTLIWQLQYAVESGMNLSVALSYFPIYFSKFYRAFIGAGEASGRLNEILSQLAAALNKEQQLVSGIKKALSYPIFLLVCTVVVSAGIMLFIIPEYQTFFAELGGQLPYVTVCLLRVTRYLQTHGLWMALLWLVVGGVCYIGLQCEVIKMKLQRLLLKIPLLGTLVVLHTLSHWSYLLAMLLTAKLPLLTAIEMANTVIQNVHLQKQFKRIPSELTQGMNLQACLRHTGVWSLTTLQMILIAESTSTLPLIFSSIADNYHADLSAVLLRLAKYTEPVVMLLLAGFTGLIIVALYLPMVNLGLHL